MPTTWTPRLLLNTSHRGNVQSKNSAPKNIRDVAGEIEIRRSGARQIPQRIRETLGMQAEPEKALASQLHS